MLAIHLPGIAGDMNHLQNGDSTYQHHITKEDTEFASFATKRGYSSRPDNKVKPIDDFPRFRMALGGGYSYRLAPIADDLSPEMTDYIRGLKNGFHFQGELSHYFTRLTGLGVFYSITHAKTEGQIMFPNGLGMSLQKASSTVTTHFIGPQLSLRFLNASQRNGFLMNFALGYVSYIQENRVAFSPSRITGSALGLAVSYAYEIGVSDNVAIGVKLSGVLATLTEYKEESHYFVRKVKLESDQYEGLSRIDMSLYLRFVKM